MPQHQLVISFEEEFRRKPDRTLKAYLITSAELLLAKHFSILISVSDLLHSLQSSSYHLEPNSTPDLAIAWQLQRKLH